MEKGFELVMELPEDFEYLWGSGRNLTFVAII